jgi:hypothetical protein
MTRQGISSSDAGTSIDAIYKAVISRPKEAAKYGGEVAKNFSRQALRQKV